MKIFFLPVLFLFFFCSCSNCPETLDTSDLLPLRVTEERIALINSFDINKEKERGKLLSLLSWNDNTKSVGFMNDNTMTSIIAYIANGRHRDREAWKALEQMQQFMDGEWGGMKDVLFYELDLSGIPSEIWLKHIPDGENTTCKEQIDSLLERENQILKQEMEEEKEGLEGSRARIRYLKCMIAHFEKRRAALK